VEEAEAEVESVSILEEETAALFLVRFLCCRRLLRAQEREERKKPRVMLIPC
jgi:hypothetical protein